MSEDRLDRLEMHAAEQARVIEDLSEALALLQKDIERLKARLAASDARIGELEAGLPQTPAEKPPHY
ncbi:MAG: SlyX family protein [Oceanicaulis sp.]